MGPPSPRRGGGVGALSSPSATLLGGGVLVASSSLVGLLAAVLAEAGSSSAPSDTVAAAGCSVVCGAASPAAAVGSATLWPATWSGSTSDATLTIRQHLNSVKTQQQKRKTSQHESKNANLQVRAPVRCGEPPPDPTGRCLRPRLYGVRWLDVRSRCVTGHPTSGGRRNVRTTVRPPDQRWRDLLLLIVNGDPDEPTALWRLATLCWQRWRRGRVCC